MSVGTLAAVLALALSTIARRRRGSEPALALDDVVIGLTLHAGLVGVTATLLAWAGVLSPHGLALALGAQALALWPWTRAARSEAPREPASSRAWISTVILLVLVTVGVGLRTPTIPAALAGRDQGTYMLRAQLSLRTGSLGTTDSLLERAGDELVAGRPSPGALDLLGLYPSTDASWRRDHYDAAYRPGFYLGDREAGEVVPQFFHLHPMLLAATGAALGVDRIHVVLPWLAGLWLACMGCVARRLWPRGPWAGLALALIVASPLAIWTARTPLSESPMALFWWTAALAALRMRDGVEPESSGAWIVAACLGFCAGVRGNALVILPVVLAIAWLRPARPGARAAYLVLGALVASVILHAATSYPYVHDELLRRVPGAELGPASLATIAVLAAVGWLVIDRELRGRSELAAVIAGAPKILALACLGAFWWWWSLRSGAPPGRPYSRLDPAPILLGVPLLGSAAAGVIVVARRWQPRPEEVWLVALAAVIPATALLYAPRQLPTLAFFYYGRYLVPELLPAAALAACLALERGVAAIAGGSDDPDEALRRRRVAIGVGVVAGLGLLASVVAPLIRHPQLRLREHAAAQEAVEWLAQRLPEGAIVIAGGEGWHSGHTHNQVGGALAMTHGVEVLPYRTREDAWISAWELLVAGPERYGEPAPELFVLINEAAHQHTRDDGIRVALLDEQLWAPFSIERVSLLELFVHALTPLPDQLPTRVARHELRMALLKLRVDPEALARIEIVELGSLEQPKTPPNVAIRGGLADGASTCVSPDQPLSITLPRPADAAHLVIVAGAASEPTSARIPDWAVTIDGQPVEHEPPAGLRAHPRATLGPMPLSVDPSATIELEIRGAKLSEDARGPDGCEFGRVARILLLPRERGSVLGLDPERIEQTTIAPAQTLGHPIQPTSWVVGRSLSRYRPGTSPTPEIAGLAMVLAPGMSLSFAPVDLPLDPAGRPLSLDVIVTLANTRTAEGAVLDLYADDRLLGSLSPPAMRDRSFVAEPIRWQPERGRAQLRIELDSRARGTVDVRDVALFGRTDAIGSDGS